MELIKLSHQLVSIDELLDTTIRLITPLAVEKGVTFYMATSSSQPTSSPYVAGILFASTLMLILHSIQSEQITVSSTPSDSGHVTITFVCEHNSIQWTQFLEVFNRSTPHNSNSYLVNIQQILSLLGGTYSTTITKGLNTGIQLSISPQQSPHHQLAQQLQQTQQQLQNAQQQLQSRQSIHRVFDFSNLTREDLHEQEVKLTLMRTAIEMTHIEVTFQQKSLPDTKDIIPKPFSYNFSHRLQLYEKSVGALRQKVAQRLNISSPHRMLLVTADNILVDSDEQVTNGLNFDVYLE